MPVYASRLKQAVCKVQIHLLAPWGRMFQGGEIALHANCEGFDSLRLHQILGGIMPEEVIPVYTGDLRTWLTQEEIDLGKLILYGEF